MHFVLYREVVLSSEVRNVLNLYARVNLSVSFMERFCPFFRVSLYQRF